MITRSDFASRIVAAPAETVYRAFLDPRALERWLPPSGMRGEIHAFEPRAGGKYRMTLTLEKAGETPRGKSSDDADVIEGHFVEILPDRRIVQAVRFDSDDPAFAGTMRITWAFYPVAEGTRVEVLCENVPSGIRKEDHDAGLKSTLDNLAAFVEPRA